MSLLRLRRNRKGGGKQGNGDNSSNASGLSSNNSSTTFTPPPPVVLKSCFKKKQQPENASDYQSTVSSAITDHSMASSLAEQMSRGDSRLSSASSISLSSSSTMGAEEEDRLITSSSRSSQLHNNGAEGSISHVTPTYSTSSSNGPTSARNSHPHYAASSSQSRRPRRPGVRFQSVEIREYVRTVADNPSCSAGPPIGIGWDHGESHHLGINVYEHHRGHRRKQLDMVLSRNEREKLLLEWGIPFHQIAEGTRTALRVKNQRRQTIVNSGKVAKLEETFEGASRRLKSALSLGKLRTTNEKTTTKLVPIAENGQSSSGSGERETLESPSRTIPKRVRDDSFLVNGSINGSNQSPRNDHRFNPEMVEPEVDIFDKLNMKVDVSNLAGTSPMESMMMKASSSLSVDVSETEDCYASVDGFTLGATTLGNNSATPSQLEMERFYQELELECFGEQKDLPSMVGQTLEVPITTSVVHAVSDSKDVIVYESDDGDARMTTVEDGYYKDDMSLANSAFSNPQSASFSNRPSSSQWHATPQSYSPPPLPRMEHQSQRCHYLASNQYYERPYDDPNKYHATETYEMCGRNYFYQGYAQATHLTPMNDLMSTSLDTGTSSRIRQSSLDSYDLQSHSLPGGQCEYSPHYVHNGADTFRDFENARSAHLFRNANCGFRASMNYPVPQNWTQQMGPSPCFDGPEVRHIPLSSHISPTQWMEGTDASTSYHNSTVTIIEDGPR